MSEHHQCENCGSVHDTSWRNMGRIDGANGSLVVNVSYFDQDGELDSGTISVSMYPHPDDAEEVEEALGDKWVPVVQMDPYDALMLANRITRAVNILLEQVEEPANAERELKKIAHDHHHH